MSAKCQKRTFASVLRQASSSPVRLAHHQQVVSVQLDRQLVDRAGERERQLVVVVVHRCAWLEPTSKVSPRVMRNGIVCGIFFVATSAPSTFRTPVPPWRARGRRT